MSSCIHSCRVNVSATWEHHLQGQAEAINSSQWMGSQHDTQHVGTVAEAQPKYPRSPVGQTLCWDQRRGKLQLTLKEGSAGETTGAER